MELKCQEVQGAVEQRDQVVAHLQQYSAAYQTLVSEREQLHKLYLQQCQLLDRLQHDESQGRTQLEISHSQLKQAQVRFTSGIPACASKKRFDFLFSFYIQEHLEKLVRDNEELKAEVMELLNSSALMSSSRDQGKAPPSGLW